MQKLMDKKLGLWGGAWIGSLLLLIIVHQIRISANTGGVYNILVDLSEGQEVRAIIVSLFVWFLGYTFLSIVSEYRESGMAFWAAPIGFAIWVIASMILLLIGIPYTIVSALLCIVVLFVLVLFLKKRNMREVFGHPIEVHYVLFDLMKILVFINIGTIGFYYVFYAGDTYNFIHYWGIQLFESKRMIAETSEWLFSTGIGLATVESLQKMFGSNNLYTIHFLMLCSTIGIVYDELKCYLKNKWVIVGLILATISLPPILYFSGWIISNTYVMLYAVMLALIVMKIGERSDLELSEEMLLIVISLFLCFLRADSIIFISCFAISLAITKIENKYILRDVLVPTIVGIVVYYSKILFICKDSAWGLLIKPVSMLLMLGMLLGVTVYYLAFRNNKLRWLNNHLVLIGVVGLMSVSIALFVYQPSMYLECIKIFITNMTDLKYGGGMWGFTAIILLVAYVGTHVYNKSKKVGPIEFWFIILFFVNTNMGCMRGMMGLMPRLGAGDSFNRIFVSYIPIAILAMLERVNDKKSCDSSEE